MKNVRQYLQEVSLELSRVMWPTQEELFGSVLVVLVLVTLFAIYLGAIDLIFYRIAQQIFR